MNWWLLMALLEDPRSHLAVYGSGNDIGEGECIALIENLAECLAVGGVSMVHDVLVLSAPPWPHSLLDLL